MPAANWCIPLAVTLSAPLPTTTTSAGREGWGWDTFQSQRRLAYHVDGPDVCTVAGRPDALLIQDLTADIPSDASLWLPYDTGA